MTSPSSALRPLVEMASSSQIDFGILTCALPSFWRKMRGGASGSSAQRISVIDHCLRSTHVFALARVLILSSWNEGLFGGKALQPRSLEAMTTTWAKDYGYGLVIQTDFHRKHASHGGRISGFYNYIEYFPGDRVIVVVPLNIYDSDPPLRNAAFDLAVIVQCGTTIPYRFTKGARSDYCFSILRRIFPDGVLGMLSITSKWRICL